LKSNIPHALASAIPDPILYEHGLVGECNDLIFGFSLVDYATANGLSEGSIPKIVRICIEEIDKRGLENEGIYRVSLRHLSSETHSTLLVKVSGRQAVVQAVRIHLSHMIFNSPNRPFL
jgi:RhoGAP domain